MRPFRLLQLAQDRVIAAVHAVGGTERPSVWVRRPRHRSARLRCRSLVTFPPDADIVTLSTLEEELSDLLSVPVHVISAGGSGPLLERAIAEAIPLPDLTSDHLSQ